MTKWTPISLNELFEEIEKSEKDLNGELWNFWQITKVYPTKWIEKQFGDEGSGFWVVALCGTKVIWYNDIEEGFNISDYKKFGHIEGYYCNQDKLSWAVIRLFDLIKFGGEMIGQSGPPEPLDL